MKKIIYAMIAILIVVGGLMNVGPNYDKYKHLPWEVLKENLIKRDTPYEMKYSANEYFEKNEVIEARVVDGTWKITVCNGIEALEPTLWEPDPYTEFKIPKVQVNFIEPSVAK